MKQNIIMSTNIKIFINTTFVKSSLTYLIKLTYLFVFIFNAQTIIISILYENRKNFWFSKYSRLFINGKNVLNFLTEL